MHTREAESHQEGLKYVIHALSDNFIYAIHHIIYFSATLCFQTATGEITPHVKSPLREEMGLACPEKSLPIGLLP